MTPTAQPNGTAMLSLIQATLEDSKGLDPVVIDLTGKSSIADHMIIVTGTSSRHVSAMAAKVAAELKQKLHVNAHTEGEQAGDWVLIDAGDVIVHLFRQEVRDFYNLEKMWTTDFEEFQNTRPSSAKSSRAKALHP